MSNKVYLQKGPIFTVTDKESMDYLDKLPVGNFLIKHNPFLGGYYFEQIDSFTMDHKVYGNTTRHADRILATFRDRPASTGVLLSGEKGSGKTLLAKRISMDAAAAEQMPTIIINTPLHGDEFNQFIQELKQPAIMLFDEFEKVYDREQQDTILTLLDGVFASKKLFIMTCNDVYRINDYMRNRPGRIFYAINYDGIDADFIREYCEDNLKNKNNIDGVCRAATLFERFNFDMLKALVEEMNRYNETARQALELLNAKPIGTRQTYDVKLVIDGIVAEPNNLYPESFDVFPLEMQKLHISLSDMGELDPNATVDEDGDKESKLDGYQVFTQEHLTGQDMVRGIFQYDNGRAQMTLTRSQAKKVDFRDWLGD